MTTNPQTDTTPVGTQASLAADQRLLALETQAERDGYASLALSPVKWPGFCLEAHTTARGLRYRRTGRQPANLKVHEAMILLKLFAADIDKAAA